MARETTKKSATYANIDDVRTICPNIGDYLKPFIPDPDELKAQIRRCLKLANVWIHNQLKESEANTYARSNEKNLVEANYAVFLILRGTLRGERAKRNEWFFSYKEEAEKLLYNIIEKATARSGLATQAKRFTKKRFFFPDFGSDVGFT